MERGVDISVPLRRLLAERGWTQQKLAKETGIRRTDINRLANGKTAGADRRRRIAAALSVSEADLGVPEAVVPGSSKPVGDRLQELEAVVRASLETQKTMASQIRRLQARLRQLEAQTEAVEGRRAAP